MFPEIKSIFKSNNNNVIPNLLIKTNSTNLLNTETIDMDKTYKQADDTIIAEPQDKANVLAKYLADINNKTKISNSPSLERIIIRTINDFLTKNNRTNNRVNHTIKFTKENTALNPKFEHDSIFFTLSLHLKKLYVN